MKDELTCCDHCGAAFPTEELIAFDGQLLCQDCLDDDTIVCSYCGQRIWNEDNEGTSSVPLCHTCLENHYTRCEHCGRLLHQGDAYYTNDGDEAYCFYGSETTLPRGIFPRNLDYR